MMQRSPFHSLSIADLAIESGGSGATLFDFQVSVQQVMLDIHNC